MKNARRFDHRITIGPVPGPDDIRQLAAAAFKSLIDLGGADESLGEPERRLAASLGLTYTGIAIERGEIDFEDVLHFYLAVFERGRAPIYAFSRQGRRPLAFLLLLEAVILDRPLHAIFETARLLDLALEQDRQLHRFFVDVLDRGRMKEAVALLQQLRPDLVVHGSSEPLLDRG
jgi:protein tyrosine phosphatase (PTP) superfamily phosphohydrolase (DUF442 family)